MHQKIPKFGKIETITLNKRNLKDQNSIWGCDVQYTVIHYRGDIFNSLQSLIGIL